LEKKGVLPGEVPSDRDLLTCGQCRHSFPLAHILVFIEHKKGRCQGGTCLKEAELLGHSPPSPPNRTFSRSPMEPAVQVASRLCEWSRPGENGISVKQENSVEGTPRELIYRSKSRRGSEKRNKPPRWWLLKRLPPGCCPSVKPPLYNAISNSSLCWLGSPALCLEAQLSTSRQIYTSTHSSCRTALSKNFVCLCLRSLIQNSRQFSAFCGLVGWLSECSTALLKHTIIHPATLSEKHSSISLLRNLLSLSPCFKDSDESAPTLKARGCCFFYEGEPSCYICQSCKELFPSAWFLLQHAQSTHGLSIYLEDDPLKGCPPRDRESGPLSSLREKIHQQRLASLQKTDSFSPSFTPPPRQSLPHQINYLYPEIRPEMQPYPQPENGLSDRFDSPGQDQALNFSARLRELAGNVVSAEPPSPGRGGSPFLQTTQPPCEGTPPAGGRAKSCEFCGKTFKSLSNLVVHRRSHTGEKPYHCPFCDHACTQSSKLKRHMKTHRLEIGPQAWESCLGEASALKARAKEYEGYQGADKTKPDAAKKSHESEGQEFVLQAEVSEKLPEKKNHWPGSSLCARVPARMRKLKDLYPSIEEQEAEDLAAGQLPSDTDLQELANKSLLSSLALTQASPGKQGLLSFLNRRIKLEQEEETSGIPPLPPVYQNSLYSQWLSGYNGSINSISDTKDPTPDSRRASPFGNASEHSLENSPGNNGDSRVLTEDSSEEALSSESGIASGNCTPKQTAGGGGGKRADTCEFCGKRFKNSSNLTVHRRSHTGERPYHCTLCSYACAQSSKLTRHMKTHAPHGGKAAFTCQVCHVPFSVYSTLEKHMKKRHANEEATTDSSGTAPCEIRQEQQHSQARNPSTER
ncbi:BC11B protein, partial [Polyodon spathula]|nr:BC11B protein [Polyodon spathula]